MKLHLGIKSDPVEYRYSFPWLFRLMADEGVTRLQLGSFFEVYQLPDDYFRRLKKQAGDFGIEISSLFTAHRELGGFFREDPEWAAVARRNFERFIEVGALLGAKSVGSNPGATPRDLMGLKKEGTGLYLKHLTELMHLAKDRGIDWLTVEPMSCLAEPPTLPDEIAAMGEEIAAYHAANSETTARVGYCADIAHGYKDQQGTTLFDHVALFDATLPWLYEVHLKNTDDRFHSTFGFGPGDLEKGIVDAAFFRDRLYARASEIPVDEITGYLEIGGPKLGRDYTDCQLADQIRISLRYLKEVFLADPKPVRAAHAKQAAPEITSVSADNDRVQIAPSMMCVDPLNFESELRLVEALGMDMLHIDIMDGHYVPNMPVGVGLIPPLRKKTSLPIDVHLMVSDPDFFIELLAGNGVDRISVHAETAVHLDRTLARIREQGSKAGVAINPGTSLHAIECVLDRVDYVLVMTVNPGFAGQQLTPGAFHKIAECRRMLDHSGHRDISIQVDGNVSFENIPHMVAAGARNLVAGTSSIFHRSASWRENLVRLRAAITAGLSEPLQTL